jgi:intein/homing endonuclease
MKMKDTEQFKIKSLSNGNLYCVTPEQLKKLSAKQFKEGDIIKVSKYYIHIEYKQYDTPALCTWIEDENFKSLDCTPGCGTPYYIDDFKSR